MATFEERIQRLEALAGLDIPQDWITSQKVNDVRSAYDCGIFEAKRILIINYGDIETVLKAKKTVDF